MRTLLSGIVLIYAAVALGQDCTQYNKDASPFDWNVSGSEGHTSGYHSFDYVLGGSCTYSGSNPGQACASMYFDRFDRY